MKRWLAIAAVAIAVAAVLWQNPSLLRRPTRWALAALDQPLAATAAPIAFTVAAGDTADTVAPRLERAGLIRSGLVFRAIASYHDVGDNLVAGDYDLAASMTATEMLDRLHRGLVRPKRVTIPEGLRLEEVARLLQAQGVLAAADFEAAARSGVFDYASVAPRPPGATLEGYLFPDTYLAPRMEATAFVEMMVRNFDSRFTPDMRSAATRAGLTIHQVVTLASIVEREAAVAAERPLIAAVYLNRQRRGMLLEADPTVQYALGSISAEVARFGYWKLELLNDDLAVNSPYNTYRHLGLPPGPIASPGLASLEAVLNPATTDALYFVAKGDGSHAFAATFDEHRANVARYQR